MDYNLPPDYEERKRKLLISQGFDPLVDDLDLDTMSVVPRQEKPAGNLEAFGTSAAYNLPEAASSVIGARLGSGIVSGLGRLLSKAPVHPALKVIGTLAGALGAPMATAGLTQPIKEAVSPGVTERLNTMKLDSPWATGLGAQASGLPFFKPSNPFRTALPNVAAGVGLGAGIPIAQDLAEGSDINIAEAVSGAVGGAFMSEPTRLGSWLGGLKPTIPQQDLPTPDPAQPKFVPRIVQKKPVEPPIEQSVLDTGEQTYPETGFEGWKPPVEKPLPLKQPQESADWETAGGEYPQPDPTAPKPIQIDPREVPTLEDTSGPPAEWRDAKPINFKPGLPGELQDALALDAPSEQATVGTSEQVLIREPNVVLQQQTQLALDPKSTRSAVLFTPGEVPITPIPRGLVAMDTPHGTVYWNPKKTTVDRIMKAASGKVFDSTVLGMSDPGMVRVEGDRIVTTTSRSGVPNVAVEVVPQKAGPIGLQRAMNAQSQSVPGGTQQVKKPNLVREERLKMEAEEAEQNRILQAAENKKRNRQVSESYIEDRTGTSIHELQSALQHGQVRSKTQRKNLLAQADNPGRELPMADNTGPEPSVQAGKQDPEYLRWKAERKNQAEQRKPGKANFSREESDAIRDYREQNIPETPTDAPLGIDAQDAAAGYANDNPEVRSFGLPFGRSKIKSRYGPQDEPEIRPRARLNPFKSEVDKLRAGGPQQAELADSLDLLHNKHREYNGRYANVALGALEKLTPEEQQRVYDVMIKEDRMNQDLSARLTTKEKAARTELRAALRQMATDQIAAGQGIKMTNGLRRTRGVDPFYTPNIMDQGVRRILSEGQGSKQFKDLERDFIQWQVGHGISNAEAEKRFTKILGTFSHAPEGNQFSFKAARMPEGIGLPDSWIERDPMRAFRTYINKFTKDRAFYDVIESDPRMMKMLGSEHYGPGATIPNTVDAENLTRDPQVQRILTSFIGADNAGKEPVISGIGRFVNSLLLGGPLTKLTDIGTVPFKALAYVPNGHEGVIVKGIADWRKGYKDAFDQGFNRRGGLVVAQDILGMGEKAADALSQAAEMVTKITGSEQLELVSRGLAQSIGNYIAESHVKLAKGGNKASVKFLEKLGKDWQTASPKELGTRVGQLLQGRYDITNLPTWAMNGPAAPFVTMMRWSIEQTNNFVKHVVDPAIKDGNLGPFVKTIIGGVGGGLLLNEMREELSGKKPYTASWKELEEGKDEPGYKDAITYKMIGAAQVTGTAGILMEIIRQGYEELTGRMPQGFRYPVYEVGKDVLQRMVAGVNAIREGEDVEKVGSELTKDLLTRHVQIIRTVRNQLGKHGKLDSAKQDIDKSNMMRDEDVYNRMMDKPQAAKVQTPPSYSRLTEREFDKEEDLGKAASMVPGMIKRGVERAKGDPATLQSEMRKLSTIDVRGMPSPDRDPAGFARYYGWLEKTQGQEKARQLASEFMQRRARAEVKRDFIPKIKGQ